MSSPIVAHPAGRANLNPPRAPQTFTIRCAGCDGDEGRHLAECPGALAIGYDTGRGAVSMRVYPEAGASFGKHADALGSFRFYSVFGPVEMHMEDGTVVTFDELIR
ncbi:MAG TPA: hypothetical protein VFU12_14165 [Glycomyces sp.]|nr:hypothetical protein [Glycomyces sp.]